MDINSPDIGLNSSDKLTGQFKTVFDKLCCLGSTLESSMKDFPKSVIDSLMFNCVNPKSVEGDPLAPIMIAELMLELMIITPSDSDETKMNKNILANRILGNCEGNWTTPMLDTITNIDKALSLGQIGVYKLLWISEQRMTEAISNLMSSERINMTLGNYLQLEEKNREGSLRLQGLMIKLTELKDSRQLLQKESDFTLDEKSRGISDAQFI